MLKKISINYSNKLNNSYEMIVPSYLKDLILEVGNQMHHKIKILIKKPENNNYTDQ